MLWCIKRIEDSNSDDELIGVAEEFAAMVRHVRKVVTNFDEEMMETIDFREMRR